MKIAEAIDDPFQYLTDYHFDVLSKSDVDIAMRDLASLSALFEARNLPGISYAEPVLGIRSDPRHGQAYGA